MKFTEQQKTGAIRKLTSAWKLWNDKATPEAQKATIKETIERMLEKYGWGIDWKTGRMKEQPQKQSAPPKQSAPQKDAKPPKKENGGWSTKDLAAHISKVTGKIWTPKMLRRYLRQMEKYNDNVMTHYSWEGPNDPMVKEVVEFIKSKGKTA